MDHSTLKTYLGLYANEHSITMNDIQYEAINTLFELGYKHGFYDQIIRAQDYLIPTDYESLRNS